MKNRHAMALMAVASLALAGCSDDAAQPGDKPPTGDQQPDPDKGPDKDKDPATGGGGQSDPGSGTTAEADNLPPQITGFQVESATVAVGGTTSLEISVVDVEKDPFHIWWRASCGALAQDSVEPGKAIFIAPAEPGPCKVTVRIQDADMQTTAEHVSQILVTPAAETEADDVR